MRMTFQCWRNSKSYVQAKEDTWLAWEQRWPGIQSSCTINAVAFAFSLHSFAAAQSIGYHAGLEAAFQWWNKLSLLFSGLPHSLLSLCSWAEPWGRSSFGAEWCEDLLSRFCPWTQSVQLQTSWTHSPPSVFIVFSVNFWLIINHCHQGPGMCLQGRIPTGWGPWGKSVNKQLPWVSSLGRASHTISALEWTNAKAALE